MIQELIEACLVALLARHKSATEREVLDGLKQAKRLFLISLGWEEREPSRRHGGWWPPRRYYKGGHVHWYSFEHAVNSQLWVLRNVRGLR